MREGRSLPLSNPLRKERHHRAARLTVDLAPAGIAVAHAQVDMEAGAAVAAMEAEEAIAAGADIAVALAAIAALAPGQVGVAVLGAAPEDRAAGLVALPVVTVGGPARVTATCRAAKYALFA